MARKRRKVSLSALTWSTKVVLASGAICVGLSILIGVEVAGLATDRLPPGEMGVRLGGANRAPSTQPATQRAISWQRLAASRHLFKPSARLPTRRRVARTIEQIRSRLALRGVLSLSGKPTAYIEVKGQGLMQFTEGEQTDEFKVLHIGSRSVQLDILGEQVTLQ